MCNEIKLRFSATVPDRTAVSVTQSNTGKTIPLLMQTSIIKIKYINKSKINQKLKMYTLNEQNFTLLKQGFAEVSMDGDFTSYYFVGAPFTGLYYKKKTVNQIQRLNLKKKNVKPCIHVKIVNDDWSYIFDEENACENDFSFVKLIEQKSLVYKKIPSVHVNKENNKRDSKRHSPEGNDRIERLSNRRPELALKLKQKMEHHRLQKIYKIQANQEKKNIDKLLDELCVHGMKSIHSTQIECEPTLQGFGIPVNITFPQFNDVFEDIIKAIPQELMDNIKWIDISMALYELFNTSSFASKWLSCRIIYKEFGIQTMSISVFGGLVFQLLKKLGFLDNSQVKEADRRLKVHYIEASSTAIVITLILTLIFKQKPKENTIEKILAACKEIPSTSTGIEMVMNAAQTTLSYITKSHSEENTIESSVSSISKRVSELLTPEGQKSLETERGVFEEIALMKIKALELTKFIRPHSAMGVHFNQVNFNLNSLYNKSQVLSSSGHGYRKRPVVFHLHGGAGIGKTRLVNYISADTISTILQLEDERYLKPEYAEEFNDKVSKYEQFVYFRPVGLKYQQNFNTHYSKIYVCDDANQISPSFQAGESTYPMELIHLNNSHDHMLNVAEIENKKNALFRSSLIIATDNMKQPDLYYLVCAEAYERRIDFSFEVRIKKEFGKNIIVGNNKPLFVVDEEKLDRTLANTHIYEFVDHNKNVFGYEDVIEMLEHKLISVNEAHSSDITLFKSRAVSKTLERRNIEVAHHLRTSMENHYNEKIKVHGFSDLFKKKKARTFDDIYTEINGFSLFRDRTTIFEKCKNHIRMMQMWFISFTLLFFSWETIDKIRGKYIKSVSIINRNRTKILLTAGILTALIIGFKKFKSMSAEKEKEIKKAISVFKNKNRKGKFIKIDQEEDGDSEGEDEIEEKSQGKYDSGQAKKSVPKGKKPSNKPIKSVPLHSDRIVTKESIDDIGSFVMKPNTQIACPRAYMMMKYLCSNSYYIFFEYTRNGKRETAGLRGFFIRDGIFITNRHLLTEDAQEYNTGMFHLYNIFTKYNDIPVAKVSVNTFAHEDDENDLYYDLIWIDFGRNVKNHFDISKFGKEDLNFVKQNEMQDLIGTKISVFTLSIVGEFAQEDHKQAIMTGNAKWIGEVQHTRITDVPQEAMLCNGREGEDLYTWNTMQYPMQSLPGYCGSVVIINDQSAHPGKIAGIHMAGYDCMDKSYGQLITYEIINSISRTAVHMKMIPGEYNTVVSPNDFSFLRTVPHTLRSPNKTKLRESIFHNKIYKTQKAPAKMGVAPDGEHVMYKAMKKYLRPHHTIGEEQESIFSSILYTNFKPHRKIRELNRIEAIKGIEGNQYICAINRASSAGYPLNVETKKMGKREYLGENEDWIFDHPRVESLIQDFKNSVINNERPEMAFVATIKDELLAIPKVEIWKSRAFAAAPLPYTIIFREKYLDFFASVMENRIHNFSLVGVNMYSDDVDTMVKLLTKVAPSNSKQFLAGDFSNFDGTLNLNMLWQIYDVIESMYGRKNKLCESLWRELVDSQQLFGNTVIHVPRGQPSGNPATTLINTLYNVALVYMVLYEVMEEIGTVESFDIQENLLDHFKGLFYGDDNLLSFSAKMVSIMDPNLLTKIMQRYGHIYTTDAKDTTHFEYRYLSEVTILKRHFSYDSTLRCWIAPLELVSILEPINWDKVQDNHYEMKEIQMQVNVRTALRELSLHTSEVFKQYSTQLLQLSDQYGLDLTPDCRYNQTTLRRMVRRSDNVFFFSNDFFPEFHISSKVESYNIDLDLELEKEGITIQLGNHLDSSPIKELQTKTCYKLNPTVHMNKGIATTIQKQYIGPNDEEIQDNQIVTLNTAEPLEPETMPMQREISQEKLKVIAERRDHSIKDILCRMYVIRDISIPAGGTEGETIVALDLLSEFLSQANPAAKLEGFGILRTSFKITILTTTNATTSGSLIVSFFPSVVNVVTRSTNLLQLSQTPNKRILLSSSEGVQMKIPFIAPFYGKNLITSSATLGNLVIARMTRSTINATKIRVYIQACEEDVHVEYPTFADQAFAALHIEQRIKDLQKQQQLYLKQATFDIIPQAEQLLPKVHMMSRMQNMFSRGSNNKQISTKPVKSVKWHPGMNHVNDVGDDVGHDFSLTKGNRVETTVGTYGSEANEMSVDFICKSQQIIGSFTAETASVPNQILFATPCTIAQFVTTGVLATSDVFLTHQTWLASAMNKWMAKLKFDITFTGNPFQKVTLRAIFNANDIGSFGVGDILTHDQINKAKSKIMEFDAQKITDGFEVDPVATTAIKNVPSTRDAAANASITSWRANRLTEACSYGMFYIIVEVPVITTNTSVANFIDFVVDFSTENLLLSDPCSYVPLAPNVHMMKTGILEGISERFNQLTRSQVLEGKNGRSENALETSNSVIIKEVLGDNLTDIRQVLSIYTPFAPPNVIPDASALLIEPFIFRALVDMAATPRLDYVDWIDYFSSGYGFYKGGMNIRIGKVSSESPLGEMVLITNENSNSPLASTAGLGVITIPATQPARTGTRALPLYAEECIPQVGVPYYQPYHMARITNSQAFNSGNQPKSLLIRPYSAQTVRVYRAVKEDFTMGFLTALPAFRLNTRRLYSTN